jgi:hypothetical protein
MNDNIEPFAYMLATEKMINMIAVLEQNLEFFDEYKIVPDEAVKKILLPLIEQMKKWAETK